MRNHYYSTQAFLEWALNHYFYQGIHFAWVAAPFYPYKLDNPSSSNPYELYANLLRPWIDADPYDYFVESKRLHVRKGVMANTSLLGSSHATRLKRICARIDQIFLYPVVYRVDIEKLDHARLNANKGSALAGSSEFLITDLTEPEFDMLFLDYDGDADFSAVASGSLTSDQVFDILENRC